MIFHLCLFCGIIVAYFLICSNKRTQKRELLFLRLVFLAFFVIMATRGFTIGTDTPMYLKLFKKCAQGMWGVVKFGGYFEPGYLALNVILSYLSKRMRFFIVITSLIICGSFYRFIKENSKNYFLSVLIFVGLLFIYSAMNITRQFIAISIVLLGFKYIKEKKLIEYILVVVAASFFHSSAWTALIVYPLCNLKYSRAKIVLLSMIGIVAAIMIESISNSFMNMIGRTNYYESRIGVSNMGNLFTSLLFLTAFVFARFVVAKKKGEQERFSDEDSMYLLTLFGTSVISFVGVQMDVMSRTICYLSILSMISIPNITEIYLLKNSKNKLIIVTLIVLLLFSYSSGIIILKPEWNTAYDYKSCLTANNCGDDL